MVRLRFTAGTLEVHDASEHVAALPPGLEYDTRTRCYRARALDYASVVRSLLNCLTKMTHASTRSSMADSLCGVSLGLFRATR